MLDRGPRRRAGATIVSGYGDVIGLCLGHTRCNRADAVFGDQFDADRRAWIAVLQIVNQLRQIFDRIDVVMRRRRNQPDARNGETQFRDVLGNLVAGQLATLAGFRTLCHLDLYLIGAVQVLGGHAEAAGGNLLDLGTQRIAFLQRNVALDAIAPETAGQGFTRFHRSIPARIFPAFAGIGFPADPVHRQRQRRMRLGRN